MSAAVPCATCRDVPEAPPHKVARIVCGALHTHPGPALPHAVAVGSLDMNIGSPFGFGRGGPGGRFLIADEHQRARRSAPGVSAARSP